MILTLILIHTFELMGIAIYLLIRKNNKLEDTVRKQYQYINAMDIYINNSNEKLKELDINGAFRSDDEVGIFFENLKEIQENINGMRNSI